MTCYPCHQPVCPFYPRSFKTNMHSILKYLKNHKLIILVTLLGPLLYNAWLYHDYHQKLIAQQQVSDFLETEVLESEKWLEPIKDLSSLKSSLLARLDVAQSYTGENIKKYELLVLLSMLPDGVILQSLKAEGSEIDIYGIASSTKSLEKFVGQLNKAAICESGKVYPKPAKLPGSFSIYCDLGYGYSYDF